MTTPTDRKYADRHEWLRAEPDGTYAVGITDHAQGALGDSPEKINEDAYAAWMFRIRPDDAAALATLVDAAAYRKTAGADQP